MVVFFFYHYKLSVLTFIAYLTLSGYKTRCTRFPKYKQFQLRNWKCEHECELILLFLTLQEQPIVNFFFHYRKHLVRAILIICNYNHVIYSLLVKKTSHHTFYTYAGLGVIKVRQAHFWTQSHLPYTLYIPFARVRLRSKMISSNFHGLRARSGRWNTVNQILFATTLFRDLWIYGNKLVHSD